MQKMFEGPNWAAWRLLEEQKTNWIGLWILPLLEPTQVISDTLPPASHASPLPAQPLPLTQDLSWNQGVNVRDSVESSVIVNTITKRESFPQHQQQQLLRVTYLTQCPVQPAEV